ncbi:MAG: precorrin-6y C5,15-methyltransferase (decarboxylating) subunit CbiE [Chromatiaceae bacterium]|nr:MAG: precorrin-6y C5,15-methyltransferase (decarboxylating) subunit CbiE [Chromatiaceae bacterium]
MTANPKPPPSRADFGARTSPAAPPTEPPAGHLPCTLVGILDDGWDALGGAARARLAAADLVLGAARTLALVAPHLPANAVTQTIDGQLAALPGLIQAARATGQRVVLLATGDPLCHGLGARLLAALGRDQVEVLPAPSLIALACAQLGRPWQDLHISSCHGADRGDWNPGAGPEHPLYPVLRAVARQRQVVVYTSPANGPDRIARALLAVGHGPELQLTVAVCLGRPEAARYEDLSLATVACGAYPAPNLLFIDHRAGHDPVAWGAGLALPDSAFPGARGAGDGLLTKAEVRAVSLARLVTRQDAILWDIGAGTGAVGLAASRLVPLGQVWAIERDPARVAAARANARRLCASNWWLHQGQAPAGLAAWPAPDGVFIGGSGGTLTALIATAAARLRPGGRLVLNLVTLDNLQQAGAALTAAGLDWDLTQVAIARGQAIAGQQRLAALNPVFVLSGKR